MEILINPSEENLKNLKRIIYFIRNKIDNKYYVGQTVKSFLQRYGPCWWKSTKNKYLKNAILKYGYENFEIGIIKHSIASIEEMNKIENEYALKYKAYSPDGYNLAPCGNNHNRNFSKEYLESMGHRNSKNYIFKNILTGEIYEIKNLSKFSREHNIKVYDLHKAISKTGSLCDGKYCNINTTEDQLNHRFIYKRRNIKAPFTVYKNGAKYIFSNIRKFMKENNLLSITRMLDLLDGSKPHYSNFTLNNDIIVHPRSKYKNFVLKSPNGKIETFLTTTDFSKKTGIAPQYIGGLLRGVFQSVKGYTLATKQILA